MSCADLYSVYLENEEPNFYSRIPHILDHLTYDHVDAATGKTEIRRLSVYAKEFYRILKQIGGDFGACWQNRDKLAELCNMSAGQVTACKKELTQNFHELGLTPLIEIQKIQKSTVKDGCVKNKTYNDHIKVKNIWGFNNAFMRTRDLRKKNAPSKFDSPESAPSKFDEAPKGGASCDDTNNNPCINNPLFKEQQPEASASPVVSLHSQEVVVPDKKVQAYNWLVSLGFKTKDALSMIMNYTVDEIAKASKYMGEQLDIKKKKNLPPPANQHGYFKNILTKRYWEQSKNGSLTYGN